MAQSEVEIIYGPMFVGLLFNICLYGVTITQCYMYCLTCHRDPLWIRIFVLVLFLADTTNSVLNAVGLYGTLITHFGDQKYVLGTNWLYASEPATTAIVASLVQGFYAWRVKTLTSNKWFALIIGICATTGLLAGLSTAVLISHFPNFYFLVPFKATVIAWLGVNVTGDVIIASILVWHLTTRKTGYPATDGIVNGIIKATVQTNLATTLCAILDIITFIALPTELHLIFQFALSKLYTNTLISTLNSRVVWKTKQGDPQTGVQSPTRPMHFLQGVSKSSKTGESDNNVGPAVFVRVEQHEMGAWKDDKPDTNAIRIVDNTRGGVRLQFDNTNSDSSMREMDLEKLGRAA